MGLRAKRLDVSERRVGQWMHGYLGRAVPVRVVCLQQAGSMAVPHSCEELRQRVLALMPGQEEIVDIIDNGNGRGGSIPPASRINI